jgi:dynactin complex subunit
MKICPDCGGQLSDTIQGDRHWSWKICMQVKQDEVDALTAANTELRRQIDELLKSVEYLRKDVTE